MKEKIGNVYLNLDFYTGQDEYSDGEIEDELLSIVKKGKSEINNVLISDHRWPILYHLTPYRYNLLEWFPFKTESTLLEVGAGCGGITGVLCEKNKKVVAVELSKKRAEINAHRNSERDNLEIIVGNMENMIFEQKFDYITLIGVLEYAGKFTKAHDPYLQFIKNIKKYLKPGGELIIAIENKFGLKYWAGKKEDHTGISFEGIEGYVDDKGIKTFSKNELKKLIKEAGFMENEFYYPMPDYKIPTQIFSDEYLPGFGDLDKEFHSFDSDQVTTFQEYLAFNNIIENAQFDFFANSFLVFCKNCEEYPV
ncbi:bifunctional 2-polyprenyl-6-hydroxyphenol methylase/3-demethylubiquinol 3-O-methyltransferase UbiG [Paenibacillus sp. S150]|uniref:class I SAM-dependent methyltransferase n=1 Tax=Paenibacillus sp. S150 TaxID=2749826 RepID=UPI001C575A13|nr:class I SAM-dependent methyltransferase [Paenibacillus sp. S150]MBW4081592.1 class I SAM-dependent methyltransferase [Paenibacillus sp. S150]